MRLGYIVELVLAISALFLSVASKTICSFLSSEAILNSTNIDDYTFAGCKSLKAVVITK